MQQIAAPDEQHCRADAQSGRPGSPFLRLQALLPGRSDLGNGFDDALDPDVVGATGLGKCLRPGLVARPRASVRLLGAVVAGFLLTAVPNWTGRLPIVGWPLAGLFSLWVAGRIAIAVSQHLPATAVVAADLAFTVAFFAILAREIVAGRNWRNLVVLFILGLFLLANAVSHWEVGRGAHAAHGFGLRLGLAVALMMIAVIGGRIVPSFTRNWLAKRGTGRLPVPPMQTFDKLALMALVGALLLWVVLPVAAASGAALIAAACLHFWRLAQWAGDRTWAEPLVLVLHAGYTFVPLGALMLGVAILQPDAVDPGPAQHVWLAGAIGLMTLAVMTRATLGHTGQTLTASPGTMAIYVTVIFSVALRLLGAALPARAGMLHALSGLGWIAAFGGFCAVYGRCLLTVWPNR